MIRHKGLCGVVLLLGVGLLALGGCNKKPKESPDAPVLEALAAYGPKPVVNEQGRVVELKLEGPRVDDGALEHVKNLPELKSLSLYESSVTDGGLAKLAESNRLESLGLGKTAVTRRGLAHLERLPALRWVWVTEGKGLTAAQIDDFKKKAVPGITVYLQ
jgi:hypothetical protein